MASGGARYIGLAKTHLQYLMTAAAINCKRIHQLAGGCASSRYPYFTVCKTDGVIRRLSNISPPVSKARKSPGSLSSNNLHTNGFSRSFGGLPIHLPNGVDGSLCSGGTARARAQRSTCHCQRGLPEPGTLVSR
jgi:hypothetical protein